MPAPDSHELSETFLSQTLAEKRCQDLAALLRAVVWEAAFPSLALCHVSASSSSILGYPRDRWLEEPGFLFNHMHPEDRVRLGEERARQVQAGVESQWEYRIIAADGRAVWMRENVSLVPGGDSAKPFLRGVLCDISPQRQAEESFQDAQKRYRYLLDYSREVIFKTDESGCFTYMNPSAPRLLHFHQSELMGTAFLDLVHPDYRSMARRFYRKQFFRRIPTSYLELPLQTATGASVWLGQNVQLMMEGGRVAGFQAIARDLTEHREATARLMESEERYRIIAETATDGILTVDDANAIVFSNHAVESIFGYPAEETVGRNMLSLIPEYPRAVPLRSAGFDLWTGRSYFGSEATEVLGRHKNGHDIPLEISIGEFTESGRHMFTLVIRDITERKRAQEEIHHKDQRFRSLIENAGDITVVVDANSLIVYESPSLERVLGYLPDQMFGRSALEAVHPDDRALVAEDLRRHREDPYGPILPRVFRMRHRDGTWRVMEGLSRNLADDPAVEGIVINLRDVTDRKRVEEELRAANETLRALIQATPQAIVAIDSEGLVTKWNPAAERIFGWLEEEVLGHPLPYIPEDQRDEWAATQEALRRGESAWGERERLTKSGQRVMVNVSSAPLRAADGSISGAVAVVTDITEHRRLEEELRQAQKMEAVGQLAGGVAHDFNNLLTVINGYNQLLMTSLPEGGRPRNYAQEVMQAAQRASSLTRQLLAFSRRQVTQPKLVDLSVIVQNMTKMLRRLINEDIDLVTSLAPLRYKVLVDPSQIEQIVLNLAVNARDAMPSGGKLTIETSEAILDEHYTRTHLEAQPGPHVQISVSDTGHGMDAEIKRRIFEPFFTTKALGKGTGLGLSTVYGIVKQAGGNIWLYSEPGIGSTFKVYLPARNAEAPAEAFVPASSNYRGVETVLLVEDEDGLRKLVVELLQQFGYRVLAAADGEEALKACTSHGGFIHLLLTDVVMPRANGKEIAKYLSKLRPAMRVLFMSGYPDETILHHGVLAPGVAFLQKPFTQEALGAKVREVLDSPVRELEEA